MPSNDTPIVARYVITGQLVLDAAGHYGTGEPGNEVDMPLLRDEASGRVFIPGSSLAGALRAYVSDYVHGYFTSDLEDRSVEALFGSSADNIRTTARSSLIVFDAFSCHASSEVRDGVRVDPVCGTAMDHGLFSLEVVPKDTSFALHLQLDVPNGRSESELVSTLVLALLGLQSYEIPLGARKSRGFGRCHAERWGVKRFDLTTKAGWREWLALRPVQSGPVPGASPHDNIEAAFASQGFGSLALREDRRRRATIRVRAGLDGGVLVRSPGVDPGSADAVHISSGGSPIIPGTSLAGVLRSRAGKIARLVREDQGDADRWVIALFGAAPPDGPSTESSEETTISSALTVQESVLSGGQSLRVNRIQVDRFTGGVVHNHLFEEEPLYGSALDTTLDLKIPDKDTEETSKAKLGLVLLCLKDLLMGDLAVGGASSVGRGFFKGGSVEIDVRHGAERHKHCFTTDESCDPATASFLNDAVRAFWETPFPEKEGVNRHG